MRLIQAVARAEDMTAVVATHDAGVIDVADRIVELRAGRIVADALTDHLG